MQVFASVTILVLTFLASNGELAFLGFDIEVIFGEAGNGDFDRKGVFAGTFNIVRGIALRSVQA